MKRIATGKGQILASLRLLASNPTVFLKPPPRRRERSRHFFAEQYADRRLAIDRKLIPLGSLFAGCPPHPLSGSAVVKSVAAQDTGRRTISSAPRSDLFPAGQTPATPPKRIARTHVKQTGPALILYGPRGAPLPAS